MRLVKKYDDGSYCAAFDVGDKATLAREYTLYDLYGHPAKVMPIGTEVTILWVTHRRPCSPNWYICQYAAECNDGARVYHRTSSDFSISDAEFVRIDNKYREEES